MKIIKLLTQLFLSTLLTSPISQLIPLDKQKSDLDTMTDSVLDKSLDEVFEKYAKLLPESPSKPTQGSFLQSSKTAETPIEDNFSYEPFVWSQLKTNSNFSPKARKGHSAVSVDTFMVIFGGCYFEDICYNDLIFLDLKTHHWIKTNPTGEIPTARGGHSANLYGQEMYVFGGSDATGYNSELYSLNLSTVSHQTINL